MDAVPARRSSSSPDRRPATEVLACLDGGTGVVRGLHQELDEPADVPPGGRPPDGLQFEPQVGVEAPGLEPVDPPAVENPQDAGGHADACRHRAQQRVRAEEQIRFDHDLPGPCPPGKKWSTVRSQIPAKGSRGNITRTSRARAATGTVVESAARWPSGTTTPNSTEPRTTPSRSRSIGRRLQTTAASARA